MTSIYPTDLTLTNWDGEHRRRVYIKLGDNDIGHLNIVKGRATGGDVEREEDRPLVNLVLHIFNQARAIPP